MLTISFLVIIFGCMILIPLNFVLGKVGIVEVNRDNYTSYVPKEENNIVDKLENRLESLKNTLENHITNNFPLYNVLNSLYQNLNFDFNKIFYNNVPLKTNSDGEYVFYDKINGLYYLESKYSHSELTDKMNKQINFFNNLAETGLDVYIYIPTRLELTDIKDNNLHNFVSEFTSHLDKRITYRVMNVDNIDTYKKYFYKTDHHWTMYGALNGYESIMEMLDKTPLNNLDIVSKNEKKYYGSLAKTALNTEVYDNILDVDYFPDYQVLVNHQTPDSLFKPRKIRTDRNYTYYDYYVSYFNGQYGNIIYDYQNPSQENLLILSDSYAWQIDYLIAASFNQTHVINLRYDEYKNKDFSLSSYVKENNISKVLFLYEGGSTIFDQYNYNFEGRIK